MVQINTYWFIFITCLYLAWFLLIKRKNDVKSLFLMNYGFNFCIFYGPLMYYKLGFEGYDISLSPYSLRIFYVINVLVVILNMIFYVYVKKYKKTLFYGILSKIKFENIKNTYFIDRIYFLILLVCLGYIFLYWRHFPLVQLVMTGDLGVRLDANIVIPHYISFSSLFMIFVPSAFLYFKYHLNNRGLTIALFLFTLFCLTAGGNKGIVSFFLMFYVLFNEKANVLKYVGLFLFLFVIYAVFKGRTELNQETIAYLLESPFRRLFAGQGSGYLARLKMMDLNLFYYVDYSIKEQVSAYIYDSPLGQSTSPTHFTGNLIVQIGYFLTFIIYFVYLYFFTKLINTTSYLFKTKENSFILWNLFIIVYISVNSGITLANGIRLAFVLLNIFLIRNAIRFKNAN